MDIRRALRLAKLAIEIDNTANVTQAGAELGQRLSELASQPSDPNAQTGTSSALAGLNRSLDLALNQLSPEEVEQIAEVAAAPIFAREFAAEVEAELRENPATPATARDKLIQAASERDGAIALLRQFIATASSLR